MTNNIPSKSELKNVLNFEYHQAKRDDKQRGTNCEGFFINYLKEKGDGSSENIRFYVKKGFLKGIEIEKFESEIRIIKQELGNIVPNQSFIHDKNKDIFVFCSPVLIKCDILEKANYQYVLDMAKEHKKFFKQLKFFVYKYERLIERGFILDLHGKENLVISDQNKLYYLDSFLIFHDNDTIKENSKKNLDYIKMIISRAESSWEGEKETVTK